VLSYVRRRSWRQWEASRAFQLGPRMYRLLGSDLIFESPVGLFTLRLAAVRKVMTAPRVLIFYLDEHNAHFLPRSAFTSTDDEAAFLAAVQSRVPQSA
jgi:hypothetical protein